MDNSNNFYLFASGYEWNWVYLNFNLVTQSFSSLGGTYYYPYNFFGVYYELNSVIWGETNQLLIGGSLTCYSDNEMALIGFDITTGDI